MNDAAIPIRRTQSGVDEFLRNADDVFRKQVANISDIEQAYAVKRAEIVAAAARRMADVAAEGSEQLRILDRQHQRALDAEQEKLAAVGRLRDG